jgi:hypothetical protein
MKTIVHIAKARKLFSWIKTACFNYSGSRFYKLFSGVLYVLFIEGCIPCYYAPNAQNVPLFTEKKQANCTMGFQLGLLSVGLNTQVACAVTDHIGLMVNYNQFSGRGESFTLFGEDYSTQFKGRMGEFGLGYYHKIEKKFVFETYGGMGTNKIETVYDNFGGNGTSTLKYLSFFIQPAMGYYNKNIQMAFSSRFRLLNYNSIRRNLEEKAICIFLL